MRRLESKLTWSFSRSRLFCECRRAYYYHYYASWGGWEPSADQLTRQAYILKNIRSIDAWIGDIVHQVIKWALESKVGDNTTLFAEGRDIAYAEASAAAKKLLMKTWEQSRSKAWERKVKDNLNLFEHYYKRELGRDQLKIKLEKVLKSIGNFYHTGLLEIFSKLPRENFLSIDQLSSFDFEGVEVFAVPDFALSEDGEYFLYDWKTGKQNEMDIWQLSCYQYYAVNKWGVSAEKVKIVPVYLVREASLPSPIRAIELEQVKDYIRQSLKEMKDILLDPEENIADIKGCPKTNEAWRCQNCKFQEVCR